MLMYLDTLNRSVEEAPEYETTRVINLVQPLRLNDQIVPDPSKIDERLSRSYLTVAANHPFHSHLSLNAMFPKFTKTRTCAIRNGQLIPDDVLHGECPKRPHTVHIVSKLQDNRYHEDVQNIKASCMEPGQPWMDWPGYKSSRFLSNTDYHPLPPKLNNPNDDRPNGRENPRYLEVLDNIQRQQWISTHKREFTGKGPMKALNLDNWEEKRRQWLLHGEISDELHSLEEEEENSSALLMRYNAQQNPCLTEPPWFLYELPYNAERAWTPRYRRFDKLTSEPVFPAPESQVKVTQSLNDSAEAGSVSRPARYGHYFTHLDQISSSQLRNAPPSRVDYILRENECLPMQSRTNPDRDLPVLPFHHRGPIVRDLKPWPGERSSFLAKVQPRITPVDKLRSLQHNFDKSTLRREYLQSVQSMAPMDSLDLRNHITTGKRHKVSGIECSVFRGVPTFTST